MNITAHVEIDRPCDEVFAFVSSYVNDPQWIGPMVEAQQVPTPTVIGTVVHGVAHVLGRRLEMDGIVTAYALNHTICLSSTRPFPQEDYRICENLHGRTRFSIIIHAAPPGVLKLATPILASLGRRQVARDVQTLKHLLEAHAVSRA